MASSSHESNPIGEKGWSVEPLTVPDDLRKRLGDDASFELLMMFHTAGSCVEDAVVTRATDRFGRILAEETSKLRQEMATSRVEMLRWSFLFWVGQLAAIAGLLAFMLRAGGR
jgi:hypothetical protein